MKQKILLLFFIVSLVFSMNSRAADFTRMLMVLQKMAESEAGINLHEQNIEGLQGDLKDLMSTMNDSMSGNYGWGTYDVKDFQSYGDNITDWNGMMKLTNKGGGSGQLSHTVNTMRQEFPVNTSLVNSVISDPTTQHYYAAQSQTILATRAASQLDFNKIQDQINYQHKLQSQIEKTSDVKSAVDLSSRIQVEGNLLQLEILRQAALANQQQALTSQASMNDALFNARFLQKK